MGLFNPEALKRALKENKKQKEKKYTILLVDDEVHNLSTLQDLLSDDYNIHTANDGQEALEFIQADDNAKRINLIISDQRMPRMTGVEFFHQSLDIIPRAKRILLTGFSDVNAIIDSINMGQIYRFILKPFDRHDLLTTVQRALEVFELETRNIQLLEELTQSLDQQRSLSQASSRFVPYDLLKLLEKDNITEVILGDHVSTHMSVMFSDIRGFTTLSEKMNPQENFSFVNSYLNRISPIIREHAGFIVKYLGDGMMAVFPQSAADCVDAGIAKLRMLEEYNIERVARGHLPLQIGIGINHGAMMLGMVGESGRLQGDVLSDAVNIAARLEGLTKLFGVSFIASESTIKNLSNVEKYKIRALGQSNVRGKKNAVSLYEIFDADPPEKLEAKLRTKELFERGVAEFMNQNYADASDSFKSVLEQFSGDDTARYYYKRSLEAMALKAVDSSPFES